MAAMLCCSGMQAQDVWIFGNNDKDGIEPHNDSLIIMNGQCEIVASATNLNIGEGASSRRYLQVAEDGSYAWLVSAPEDSITKIDPQGNRIKSIGIKAGAFYLMEESLYMLGNNGTFLGDSIFILNNEGQITDKAEYSGYDLAIDKKNHAVWIVGMDIKRLDINLNLTFVKDPVPWAALSVDIGENGGIWVALGKHPGIPESKDCVYEVSSSGDTLQRVDLPGRPNCVRYDTLNKQVWIATTTGTFLYSPFFSNKVRIDDESSFSMDINFNDNAVWVVGSQSIRKYSLNGNQLLHKKLPSDIVRYIGVKKSKISSVDPAPGISTPGIMLYPNPAGNKLTIRGAEKSAVITIFDVSGKIMMTTPLTGSVIDISILPVGIYMVRLVNQYGIASGKFLKKK